MAALPGAPHAGDGLFPAGVKAVPAVRVHRGLEAALVADAEHHAEDGDLREIDQVDGLASRHSQEQAPQIVTVRQVGKPPPLRAHAEALEGTQRHVLFIRGLDREQGALRKKALIKVLERGVDGIMTDLPDVLLEVLSK